ncbi:unnamed protein product, partial [Didymodactylos carnosus]
IYYMQKINNDGNDKQNDALKIYEKILTDNNPKLMQIRLEIIAENTFYQFFYFKTEYYEDEKFQKIIKNYEQNLFESNKITSQFNWTQLFYTIGAYYIHQNLYHKGINLWIKAIKSLICSELCMYDDAIEYLLKTDESHEMKNLLLADSYKAKNMHEEASIYYQKLYDKKKELDPFQLALILSTPHNDELLNDHQMFLLQESTENQSKIMLTFLLDKIAQHYFEKNNYKQARLSSRDSIYLKSQYISQYNP